MNFRSQLLMAGLTVLAVSARSGDSADRHFIDRVLPLLDSRCISCHGPDQQKGHLRLDSRDAMLQGGESGPALVPGDPAASLLLQAVMHSKADLEMPPKESLTPADIEALDAWIRSGAPWPKVEDPNALAVQLPPGRRLGDAWSDPLNPITRLFHGQRLDLWSLRPVQRPTLPRPRKSSPFPSRNPIDAFLGARLAEAGLEPSPEAERHTLARRVTLDLTGLPPTPAEMDQFLRDARPDAYARLVDRLLDSPRYGEHQARHWLDVVRYSDSNGFDWDEFRPQAWRYRDYVIRAFNADKPFDQFVREQLAGDEMLEGPPRTPEEQDLLIATGYLRIGPQDNSAPLFNEQARARAEWMADVTETTGSAFLGLSLGCCRCHDHKFDPLSQADHFRIRAFFQPLTRADEIPLDLAAEQTEIHRRIAEIDAEIAPVEAQRVALLTEVRSRLAKPSPATESVAASSPAETGTAAAAPTPETPEPAPLSDDEVRKAFTDEEKKRDRELTRSIKKLETRKPRFTTGLLAVDMTNAVPPTRVLYQGDHNAERAEVSPGFLSILDPNPAELRPAPNPHSTGRRLTLADWITSPSNPLTARVFVNRVWQALFGQGLVATPNDFGLAGARPTHPQLLDWLASEFVIDGWSVKRLHRLIVTSAAYRQSSHLKRTRQTVPSPDAGLRVRSASIGSGEADSFNTLLSRQNLRRLSGEQLRDAMLAAAGLLRVGAGGPPVWPELPAEILQSNPAFLDDNAEKTKGWYPSPQAERTARSVFLVQKRTVRVPFLETFDLPENSVSCPRRTTSIVAPQALSLLNSPEALEAAQAFATRVARDAGVDPETRVRRAFVIALQREPTGAELEACTGFLQRADLPELCRALLNLNEFAFID